MNKSLKLKKLNDIVLINEFFFKLYLYITHIVLSIYYNRYIFRYNYKSFTRSKSRRKRAVYICLKKTRT